MRYMQCHRLGCLAEDSVVQHTPCGGVCADVSTRHHHQKDFRALPQPSFRLHDQMQQSTLLYTLVFDHMWSSTESEDSAFCQCR